MSLLSISAEAHAPLVAAADLRLAEAAIPCRPGHSGIARNDLPKSLQTRGVLIKELMRSCGTARWMRQAKGGTTKSGLGQIVDALSILERPAEVKGPRRTRPLGRRPSRGRKQHAHRDLVERHTRFVMLLKVP